MYDAYKEVELEDGEVLGTGWLPGLPNSKDYTEEHPDIKAMSKKLKIKVGGAKAPATPASVDLRTWCSPVENQGALGSCTAHAGMGVVEYFERRHRGKHIDGSRLFLYKTTRNLMGITGDTGAWLRDTMAALVFCGVPPEKYWPYITRKNPGPGGKRTFDDEPGSFIYAVADNYEALRYFCHDPQGASLSKATVLARVKYYLSAGIPAMFGFFGFPSFNSGDFRGAIPLPCPGERAQWGHAIVAVGYDDGKIITNTRCNKKTKGAFLIRNSWGSGWGDHGYGWLPYDYILKGYAKDFWSLLNMEWVDSGQFGL